MKSCENGREGERSRGFHCKVCFDDTRRCCYSKSGVLTESWLADLCSLASVDGALARAEEDCGSWLNDLVRFSSVCTKVSQRKRLRGAPKVSIL